MHENESYQRVADVVLHIGVWDELGEAKDVVHGHHDCTLFQYLHFVANYAFEGPSKCQQHNCSYTTHNDCDELGDQIRVKVSDACYDQNSSVEEKQLVCNVLAIDLLQSFVGCSKLCPKSFMLQAKLVFEQAALLDCGIQYTKSTKEVRYQEIESCSSVVFCAGPVDERNVDERCHGKNNIGLSDGLYWPSPEQTVSYFGSSLFKLRPALFKQSNTCQLEKSERKQSNEQD